MKTTVSTLRLLPATFALATLVACNHNAPGNADATPEPSARSIMRPTDLSTCG